MELSLVGEFADLNARVNKALNRLYETGGFQEIEKELNKMCENLPERYTLALDFELKLCDTKGRHSPLRLSINGITSQGKSLSDITRVTTLPSATFPSHQTGKEDPFSTLNTAHIGNYIVIRINQETLEHLQFKKIPESIKELLTQNPSDIALSFTTECYPYSKVLALLAQCEKVVSGYDKTLAIVSQNPIFSEVLLQTHLDSLIRIFKTEMELTQAE